MYFMPNSDIRVKGAYEQMSCKAPYTYSCHERPVSDANHAQLSLHSQMYPGNLRRSAFLVDSSSSAKQLYLFI